jgi:hypothetical protein
VFFSFATLASGEEPSAAGAGIAVGAGVGASTMENQYGVVMTLTSTKAGVKLKLAPEGLKVQMK